MLTVCLRLVTTNNKQVKSSSVDTTFCNHHLLPKKFKCPCAVVEFTLEGTLKAQLLAQWKQDIFHSLEGRLVVFPTMGSRSNPSTERKVHSVLLEMYKE